MRKNKKVKKINFLPLIGLILLITIIIRSYVSSPAKYTSRTQGKDTAKVASLNFYLTEKEELNINPMYDLIETQKYNFTIHNDGDTSMMYTINLKTSKNLPLEFKLYEAEDTTKKNMLLEDLSTEEISTNYNQEKEYTLEISWKENEKDYKYSYEIDNIKIKIDSYQID